MFDTLSLSRQNHYRKGYHPFPCLFGRTYPAHGRDAHSVQAGVCRPFLREKCRMSANSRPTLTGLSKTRQMPTSVAISMRSDVTSHVTIMTGRSGCSSFTAAASSRPFIPGMLKSVMTMSNVVFRTMSTASAPREAEVTSRSFDSRSKPRTYKKLTSSSTIRTLILPI